MEGILMEGVTLLKTLLTKQNKKYATYLQVIKTVRNRLQLLPIGIQCVKNKLNRLKN